MTLETSTPVAFVNVADRDRAMAWYCGKLGFAVKSSDRFGDFLTLGATLVRMTMLPGYTAGAHPMLGWNVDDIVASVIALRDKGVVFTIYEGMGQDELGIWTAPDGDGRVAFFSDPEGNLLSLSQG